MTTVNNGQGGTTYDQVWARAEQTALQAGLEVVEYGWEQHVIIDKVKNRVYRYPRHSDAAAKLADEVAVLQTIHQQTWPILLPTLIECGKLFSTYTYIPGVVLDEQLSQQLSDDDFVAIGTALGTFLAQFHQLEPGIIGRKQTKQTTSLIEYYSERIKEPAPKLPATEHQHALQLLNNLKQRANHVNPVVVHGDLHGLNMVIDPETKCLVGVIDISEIEIGDPHQDFRKLFMTDKRLLQPAIDSYVAAGGQTLSSDVIKLWAYVNEWANICHFANDPANLTYQRARDHLRIWGLIDW